MTTPEPVFSIIVPVYNSVKSLRELAGKVDNVFAEVVQEPYELIFVDDCSPSETTWEELRLLSQEYPNVCAIRLSRNFGQASALLCGMTFARGEWVITMDDDLQHDPYDIPLLIEQRTHDVVIACFTEKKCGLLKQWFSGIKGYLDVQLLKKPKDIKASPFRLVRRHVVESILEVRTSRPFLLAMILSVTQDVVNVEVSHWPRKYGRSNYNFRKSFSLLSNMLFNNSSLMLRGMSMFGFGLAFSSTAYGFYLIIRKLFYEVSIIPGWTSMMVVVLISTGIIVFCLGILGEYIARLIASAENQTQWAIREKTGFNDPIA